MNNIKYFILIIFIIFIIEVRSENEKKDENNNKNPTKFILDYFDKDEVKTRVNLEYDYNYKSFSNIFFLYML